jgi:hypothetical protein
VRVEGLGDRFQTRHAMLNTGQFKDHAASCVVAGGIPGGGGERLAQAFCSCVWAEGAVATSRWVCMFVSTAYACYRLPYFDALQLPFLSSAPHTQGL